MPVHKERIGNNDRLIVSTADLADLLEPHFLRLQAQHERNSSHSDIARGKLGAWAPIVHYISRQLNIKLNSVPRRITQLRTRTTLETGITTADVFLIALDLNLTKCELPVLPGNLATAMQMVEIRYPEWSYEETKALATKLYNFSRAYIRATASEETLRAIATDNERRRPRRNQARAARRQREQVAA